MSDLHDIRSLGEQHLALTDPMPGGMLGASHYLQDFGNFSHPHLSDRAFNYLMPQDYEVKQEERSSASNLAYSGDQFSSTPATTIEPYHLSNDHQGRPRTTFDDKYRTPELLYDRESYLENDGLNQPAYCLEDCSRRHERAQYPTTFGFSNTHRGMYQTPYSSSVSPASGSTSPALAWSATQGTMRESSSLDGETNVRKEDIEDDGIGGDKPYARLIWDALMQAPGHRMMLREIYTWFQLHTNKARESGSNGWQNSIRHNLSMNQAFENDKSDPSISRGQPKKANSVWVLTAHAITNGVQSTTRYRKSGSGKKTPASRTPAPQRQRSGARGGRAARRAARLRRNEQDNFSDRFTFPGMATPPDSYSVMGISEAANDTDYLSIHTPTTPTNDISYNFSSAFGMPTHYAEASLFYSGEEEYTANTASTQHELVMQPKRDPCIDEIERFHYGSGLHGISM